MAYPTGMLSLTLEAADRLAVQTKTFAQRRKADIQAGNSPSTLIFDIHSRCALTVAKFNEYAAAPGIGQYAKDQKNDQSLDVAAEFNAMVAAIEAVVTEIESTFPTAEQGGTNYLLAQSWGPSGPVSRQFTPAQLAGLATTLQGVIDAIE